MTFRIGADILAWPGRPRWSARRSRTGGTLTLRPKSEKRSLRAAAQAIGQRPEAAAALSWKEASGAEERSRTDYALRRSIGIAFRSNRRPLTRP